MMEVQRLMRHRDIRSLLSYVHFNSDDSYGYERRGSSYGNGATARAGAGPR
jgi:hypothetical protein